MTDRSDITFIYELGLRKRKTVPTTTDIVFPGAYRNDECESRTPASLCLSRSMGNLIIHEGGRPKHGGNKA